jgi:sarcosine oxidase subunit gamma
VFLSESSFRHQITVRGDAADPAFTRAVEQAIGLAPPGEPNTVAGPPDLAEGPRMLWLGPDEWLVVAAGASETDLAAALASATEGQHAAVVDVSDGRAVIAISGRDARDLLAKGCPLDLHPTSFAPGRCAQTLIAHAHVIVHRVDDGSRYEVYVHGSFADYLWRWLEDAAREYGVRADAE